jgi:hypothetical protein
MGTATRAMTALIPQATDALTSLLTFQSSMMAKALSRGTLSTFASFQRALVLSMAVFTLSPHVRA